MDESPKKAALRDDRVWLAAIVVLAVAMRVAFMTMPRVVRWDEAAHVMIARSLLAGRGFSEAVGERDVQNGPMVAYLALPGVALGWPVPWTAAGIAYVCMGGLLSLPVYGKGRCLYNRRIALLAAALVAFYPSLVAGPLYWGTMTEPPYHLFIFSGLYGTCRLIEAMSERASARHIAGWSSGLGAAIGLACLTRPEAVAYLVVMLFCLVLAGAVRPFTSPDRVASRLARLRSGLGAPALASIIAVSVFLAVNLPYTIYIHRITGQWAISGKQGLAVDIAHSIVFGDAVEQDLVAARLDSSGREMMWFSLEQYDKSVVSAALQNPQQFLNQVRRNARETVKALFSQDLFIPWVLALIALGLFGRPWPRARLARELLLILMLVPLVVLWAFFVISRLLVVALPVGLLWAAVGLEQLAAWAQGTAALLGASGPEAANRLEQVGRATTGVLIAFVLAAFVGMGLSRARYELIRQPFWRVEEADWLAGHLTASSPLMARDSEVALYADLPLVGFPNAQWPQVLAYGRARGARYLVVEEKMIRDLRPQLSGLLNTSAPPAGLKFLAALPGLNATRTLVYAFEAGS